MRSVKDYQTFTNKLLGINRNKGRIFFDYRFWAGLLLFLSSRNSPLPSVIKFFLTILLRLFFSIETTSRCLVLSIPYLPHPRNIVNGAFSIGKEIVIYHNVTIGAKRIDIEFKHRPKILDGCVIATGAVVVGEGELPSNTIVKANSLVLL